MSSLRFLALIGCFVVGWVNAQKDTLRDPTQPLVSKNSAGTNNQGLYADGFPEVKIEAVFLQGDNKRVVINGQTLVEGQSWRGFNLLKIHQNGVILSNTEKQKEFLINNNNFLKDTTDDF